MLQSFIKCCIINFSQIEFYEFLIHEKYMLNGTIDPFYKLLIIQYYLLTNVCEVCPSCFRTEPNYTVYVHW